MERENPVARYAPWALRAALASVFLYHGLTKFPALGGMAEMMGLPTVVLLLVALAEVGAGLLIVAGGFLGGTITRIGAALVVPVMVGAIALAHWGQWSFAPSETHPMGGIEFQVTLILIAVYFLLCGNEGGSAARA